VNSGNPWFNRGGNYNNGVLAGPFNFNNNTGGANGNIGFRLVVALRLKLLGLCLTKEISLRIYIIGVNLRNLVPIQVIELKFNKNVLVSNKMVKIRMF